jgi:crotonobetainyl-CoA:carnitine CoA-transferase CaiB-like acyl-CoA transferase
MGAMMQSGELVRYEGRPAALEGGTDFAGPGPLDRYYRSSDGWVRLQADLADGAKRLVDAGLLEIHEKVGDTYVDLEEWLIEWLIEWLGGMTSAEAVERLTAAGVPAVVARSLEELSRDDSLGEPDVVHLHERDQGVDFYSAGRFARLSRTEKSGVLSPPGLGEHSREVLAEAGLSEAQIDALIDDGVVVTGEPFAIWGGRSI